MQIANSYLSIIRHRIVLYMPKFSEAVVRPNWREEGSWETSLATDWCLGSAKPEIRSGRTQTKIDHTECQQEGKDTAGHLPDPIVQTAVINLQ